MIEQALPSKLKLDREKGLDIVWADGEESHYSLSYLRTLCPCASCKEVRAGSKDKKSSLTSLTILPGNYAQPLKVESVERVGNYAVRLQWSDDHGSGIYSYQYLREIRPKK